MGCPVELIVTLLKSAFEQSRALLLPLEDRLRTFLIVDIDGLVVGLVVLVVTDFVMSLTDSTST